MVTLHGDSTPLRMSVIRIVDAQRELSGMGYLVAPDTVITCAHVVTTALKNCTKDQLHTPAGTVLINRPLSGLSGDKSRYRQAQVLENGWYPACDPGQEPETGLADIAILRIVGDPYAESSPLAPLAPGPQFDYLSFETYGCPKGHEENTVHTTGLTKVRIGNGRIQVESESSYRVEPGYSGAPVWSGQARSVIGIIAQDERDKSIPAGFVIPSTLLLAACPPDVRDAFYADLRRRRDELVRGIEANAPIGADNIKYFLDNYLVRPDRPVPFGGRGGFLQELDAWLDSTAIPYRFLAAPAGRGKSAVLVHWVIELIRHRPDVAVLFLPISIRFKTNDAMTALPCLAGRLSLFFPSDPIVHSTNLSADHYKAIIKSILNTLHDYPERRFVLVIDGVDEAMPGWFDDKLFPYDPPPNLKVLLSARYKPGHNDGKAWLDDLNWKKYTDTKQVLLNLLPLDRAGLSDVLACMGRPLDRLAQREIILEELYRLSEEGDPLLVSLYTEQLWEKHRDQVDALTVEAMRQLQPGFQGFFEQWYKDQKFLWKEQEQRYQQRDLENLFNLLATALAPLKLAELRAVAERAGLQRLDELSDLLASASRLVIGDGETQGYTFSHPKLGYYFLDKLDKTQQQRYEQAFVDWGAAVVTQLNKGELEPAEYPEYLLRSYIAHLDKASSHLENYLALLSEGLQKAWLAWERERTYKGFINDAERVYQVLGKHNRALWQQKGLSNLLVGEEIRYLLCRVSVRTLANNLPPELIVEMVKVDRWSRQQALGIIEQLDNIYQAETLVQLADLLKDSPVLLRRACYQAQRIADEWRRAEVIVALARQARGPELLDHLLESAKQIAYESLRTEALGALAQHLSGEKKHTVLEQMLEASCQTIIGSEYYRARAISTLAPHLKGKPLLIQKVLAAAQQITDKTHLAQALAALAPQLKQRERHEILQKALEAAHQITDEYQHIQTLVALALQLKQRERCEILHKALEAAHQITDEYRRIRALVVLVPHLENGKRREVTQKVLLIAGQIVDNDYHILPIIGPLLEEKQRHKLLDDALARTQKIADNYNCDNCVQKLIALAPYLMEEPLWLQQALDAARQIADQDSRINFLKAWVLHLAGEPPLLQQGLTAAQQITSEHFRTEVLVALAPQLEGGQRCNVLQQALDAASQIANQDFRLNVLKALAPHLGGEPSLLRQALEMAWQIADQGFRAGVLGALLDAAYQIADQGSQANVLMVLAPHLGGEPPLLRQALIAAQQITNEHLRTKVLMVLAPQLEREQHRNVLQQALDATSQIAKVPQQEGEQRRNVLQQALDVASQIANVLKELAPHLGGEPPLLRQALTAAQQITSEHLRTEVLMPLAPHFAGTPLLLQQALSTAQQITSEYRARMLEVLVPYLVGDPPLLQQALNAARQITDQKSRTNILKVLASYLVGEPRLLQQALQAAQQIAHQDSHIDAQQIADDRNSRIDVLRTLLDAAWQIADPGSRINALETLAPHLISEPLLLQQALEMARQITDQNFRARVLGALLDAACQIADQGPRANVLEVLVPYLAGEPLLLQQALEAARQITDQNFRAGVLRALALYLKGEQRRDVLRQALDATCQIADQGPRANVLKGLILHLAGEPPLLQQVLTAAQQITSEDFRTEVLIALVPQLEGEQRHNLLQQALATAQQITSEHFRTEVLTVLVPQLKGEQRRDVLQQALETIQQIASEYRARVLEALVPYLMKEPTLLQQALNATRRITDQKSRTNILTLLSPYLVEEQEPRLLQQALQAAQQIADQDSRTNAQQIADDRESRNNVLKALLDAALQIADPGSRTNALEMLAPHLIGEPPLQQALEATQQITDQNFRARVLGALLNAACQIANQGLRANVLEALAPYLAGEPLLLQQALETARQITDQNFCAGVLRALAPQLEREQRRDVLQQALDATCRIVDQGARTNVLKGLVLHLAGERPLLQQALEAARQITDQGSRVEVLMVLAPQLEREQRRDVLQQALDATCQIADQGPRTNVREALAPYLAGEPLLLQRTLEAARQIADQGFRARVLGVLAPQPEEEQRRDVLQQALEAARQIANVLKALAPHLAGEPPLLQQALTAIQLDYQVFS